MPDLAASDMTVTVEERRIVARQKRNRIKMAFGDGALTYPAGGVPLPAASSFGMTRNLSHLIFFDEDDAQGIVWKYDQDNKKLRGYVQGVPHGAAGAVVLDDYPVTAAVGTSTGASLSRESGVGAVTLMLGRMQELRSATDAPPAQTLFAEAVGW